MNSQKNFGERFLPDLMKGAIALEHLHRYCFALQFVNGREVLDIASGEGYGSAILATRSKRVVGVDIDEEAIVQARMKYASDGLAFQQGDCANIPLADQSIDVVVSFETIEHHNQHEEMLDEFRRVLRPSGLLVISSPDKLEYSDRPGFHNPFHVLELYAEEFERLLRSRFKHVRLFRQRVLAGSWLLPDEAGSPLEFFEVSNSSEPNTRLARAPYLVAVVSDHELPSIAGGVLEEDVLQLAAPVIRDANRRATAVIRALAAPGSKILRQCLDADWYLRTNVDLATAGLDRHAHWLTNGADEGRLPAEDLADLARQLVAEQANGAAAQPTEVSTPSAADYLAKLEALHDRLVSESRSAALREAGLQAGLAAASERERSLQQQLEDELAKSEARRTREVAQHQDLSLACAQLRADLTAAQERHRAETRELQAVAARASQDFLLRLGELSGLLDAASAREQAAHALREAQQKEFEQEKADLLGRIAGMEADFRQQALERESLFRQKLLELESDFRQQLTDVQRALCEQLAAQGTQFGGQTASMQASFGAQLAEREAQHRQDLLQFADRLAAAERERSAQAAEWQSAAKALQLQAAQAMHEHAVREASLVNELASVRQQLMASESARQQQARDAGVERQEMLEANKMLQMRLLRVENSASWRWTAPFRALRRGGTNGMSATGSSSVSAPAPQPGRNDDGLGR